MSLSSQHHSFDISLAAKYGIEEAIIIHHFQHWIRINASLDRNFHEGRYWTYQTFDEITAQFPYMSKPKIVNIIDKLCTGKSRHSKTNELDFEPVLMKGNFNKSAYDRTVWYAFLDPTEWILCRRKMDSGSPQNGDLVDTTPIPDTIPDTKTIRRTPPAPKGESVSPILQKGKFVKIEPDEFNTLCKEHGLEKIETIIRQINDYLASTGKKPYKDYAATIRNWIRRDISSKGTTPSNNAVEEHRRLANDVKTLFPNHSRIEHGHDYIEFRMGRMGVPDPHLIFGQNGFKEQLDNCLRKMGLKI